MVVVIFTSQQTTFVQRLVLLIWRGMDGLMKGKHAQKNFGAVGAMAPTPLSLETRGEGGGLGVVAYKDRARPPPRVPGWFATPRGPQGLLGTWGYARDGGGGVPWQKGGRGRHSKVHPPTSDNGDRQPPIATNRQSPIATNHG